MSEFNRKKNSNFWYSPLVLMVLFCVLVLFAYNIVGLTEKERETSKKKELILSQIDTLRTRQASLSNDINKLKTDEGIEETIRDKYQVVKEGEKMVTIVDQNKSTDSQTVEEVKDHSFWGWIKRTFKI